MLKLVFEPKWSQVGSNWILQNDARKVVGKILMLEDGRFPKETPRKVITKSEQRVIQRLRRQLSDLEEMNQYLRTEIKSKTRLLREKEIMGRVKA